MESLKKSVTISIATKDRTGVLAHTLLHLQRYGLSEVNVIVCDDGSQPPINAECLSSFPNGKLIRNEQARGQALARNQIAQACTTPYLLQLDDDSYPVSGSLQELIDFAESRTHEFLALALPLEEPSRGRGFGTYPSESIQVKAFVGCSVLINVANFCQLGGYADWIERIVEEEELCFRALGTAYPVLLVDLLRIRHDVTNENRDPANIVHRSYRNWFLLWWLTAPTVFRFWRAIRLVIASIFTSIRQRSPAAIRGIMDAVATVPRIASNRSPVSLHCYRQFVQLPHALDFFRDRDACDDAKSTSNR